MQLLGLVHSHDDVGGVHKDIGEHGHRGVQPPRLSRGRDGSGLQHTSNGSNFGCHRVGPGAGAIVPAAITFLLEQLNEHRHRLGLSTSLALSVIVTLTGTIIVTLAGTIIVTLAVTITSQVISARTRTICLSHVPGNPIRGEYSLSADLTSEVIRSVHLDVDLAIDPKIDISLGHDKRARDVEASQKTSNVNGMHGGPDNASSSAVESNRVNSRGESAGIQSIRHSIGGSGRGGIRVDRALDTSDLEGSLRGTSIIGSHTNTRRRSRSDVAGGEVSNTTIGGIAISISIAISTISTISRTNSFGGRRGNLALLTLVLLRLDTGVGQVSERDGFTHHGDGGVIVADVDHVRILGEGVLVLISPIVLPPGDGFAAIGGLHVCIEGASSGGEGHHLVAAAGRKLQHLGASVHNQLHIVPPIIEQVVEVDGVRAWLDIVSNEALSVAQHVSSLSNNHRKSRLGSLMQLLLVSALIFLSNKTS
mmetsp:Transcript_679/g.1583  ORF Transcript_679/g.1583 Transcript_679/m.1583 type:complete len:478 (-) Transcript_679:1185-2618(-)